MTFPARGYPLGALFVLVTVCAVLVAGVTPLVQMIQQGSIESAQFLIALTAGTLGGMVIGVILGLMQFRIRAGLFPPNRQTNPHNQKQDQQQQRRIEPLPDGHVLHGSVVIPRNMTIMNPISLGNQFCDLQ